MNFAEKKQVIGRYLDKIYSQLESDLYTCRNFENIQGSLQLEYKKLCNYAIAVKDDLRHEVIDELRKKGEKDYNNISDAFDNIEKSFRIPSVHLEEQSLFNMSTSSNVEYKKSAPRENTNSSNSYTLVGAGIGILLGGGVGVLLGKGAASIIIGSVIGGAVGGTLAYSMSGTGTSTTGSSNVPQNVQVNSAKKLNREKVHNFIQERNRTIKSLFINYINEFENVYNR